MITAGSVASTALLAVVPLVWTQLPVPTEVTRAPAARPAWARQAGATLSISAPVSANLGTATTTAGSLGAAMGDVTVTQSSTVGVLTGWTATVTATSFSTTSGAMTRTIPAAQVDYLAGTYTPTGISLGGCTTSATKQTLGTTRSAYHCGSALSVGTSVVKWTPTVGVTFPADTVAGVYSGTITHSVS